MALTIRCLGSQHLALSTDVITPDHQFSVSTPIPVSLRSTVGGPIGLFFDLTYRFVIDQPDVLPSPKGPRLSERMYEYRLLDYHLTELLVYHWQPGDYHGPNSPHLHASAKLTAQVDSQHRREIELDRRHLVTGRVTLPSVVKMLLTEFDVAPQRLDWLEILDKSEATFQVMIG